MDNNFTGKRTTTLHEAIIEGLERAANKGLTKPVDVSFAIQVALDAAGLKVIRAPRGEMK